MKRFGSIAVLVLAAVVVMPRLSRAGEDGDYRLEPITVTAQKTGESIQEVPSSVNALSDVQLEELHIENFHDMVDYVPNLFIRKNSTENTIAIRGVSSFAGGMTSSTGFYVDGMNYPLHQMQNIDFLDIERIEVLKGPQGTLYGRNSEAGVVNVITKQPGNEREGKIFADVGMWDTDKHRMIFKEGLAVNLPLIEDRLAVRITGQKEDSDGWMWNSLQDDPANGIDHLQGRMTTRWTPTDDLVLSLVLEGQEKNDGMGVYRFLDGATSTSRNTLRWNGANSNKVNADAEILKVEYDAGDVEVTSVTGRHSYDQDFANDMDMSEGVWGDSPGSYDVDILSQELRFNSKKDKARIIDWLAGMYTYKEDIDTSYGAMGARHVTEQDNWGVALFGQSTWNFADKWHLTGGLRLDYVSLDGRQDYDAGAASDVFEKNLDYCELLPTISLAYDITPDVMTYAKVAKGYLAGGFDYSTATTDEQFSYDPEYSWTYELGLKSSLLDRKMTANLALFYIDVTDKQVAQMEPTAVNPENRRIVNAAKVQSYGVELEMQYQPVKALTLNVALGYLQSELKDWEATGTAPFDYDGKTTPGSPDWSYTVGGTYRWDSGFLVGADVVGVSSYYSDTKNEQEVDGRTLVNARIGYEAESFDVTLWGKNLFDEDYNDNQWDWGGVTLAQQGAPRSFGLRVAYYF